MLEDFNENKKALAPRVDTAPCLSFPRKSARLSLANQAAGSIKLFCTLIPFFSSLSLISSTPNFRGCTARRSPLASQERRHSKRVLFGVDNSTKH